MRLSRQHTRAMSQGPTAADVARAPGLPYPDGWSALAFSSELPVGRVVTRPLAGGDVVLYRLRSGAVRAARPYCPHLGAHLGLARLVGDDLECPFHQFAFGPDGACVRTGYGTPPPRARLELLEVEEVNGAVFVWRHHTGRPAYWRVPDWHTLGHRPAREACWELAGNAQEVIENSVDIGHFATLHGWSHAELEGPVQYRDTSFSLVMLVREHAPVVGGFDVRVEVDGYGLSCLHTDIHTPAFGLHMCTAIMPVATAPNVMQFRQSNRVAVDGPSRLTPPVARVVGRLAARLVEAPLFRSSCAFTAADFPIWNTKRYQQPPRAAHGDGPIGPFRRWAARFHPPSDGTTPKHPSTDAPGHRPARG